MTLTTPTPAPTVEEPGKGLTLNLYRSAEFGVNPKCNLLHDVTQVTVVGVHHTHDGTGNVVRPVNKSMRVTPPTQSRPPVVLVQRDVGRKVWSIVPLEAFLSGKWTMAGGSFAATSDSRFGDTTGMYGAVAVHDWFEG